MIMFPKFNSNNRRRYRYGIIALVALIFLLSILLHSARHKVIPNVQSETMKGTYIALGDSVASGEGLKTYSDSSACDRTNESYPHIVAANKSLKLIDIACSGATLSAGIIGSQDVNRLTIKPQLDQLFALPTPTLVTVTIGANDIGWSEFITKCFSATCGDSADTARVDAKLQVLAANIKSMLSQIQTHYSSHPPSVVFTGYHQVFPVSKVACTELTNIDMSEMTWVHNQLDKLNTTIQNVTSGYAFARSGMVDFNGHELCSSTPWVQGVGSKAPFHPNEDGQAAFVKAIR